MTIPKLYTVQMHAKHTMGILAQHDVAIIMMLIMMLIMYES